MDRPLSQAQLNQFECGGNQRPLQSQHLHRGPEDCNNKGRMYLLSASADSKIEEHRHRVLLEGRAGKT